MPNEHIDPFHGDKEDENPEDFLRSFFRRMGSATDETRKQQFKYFLQADSHQQNVGILFWSGELDNVWLRWPDQI